MAKFWVKVSNLPNWLEYKKLLGDFSWEVNEEQQQITCQCKLEVSDAASIQARLRGLYIDGKKIECDVAPKIKRNKLREALSNEAKLRRDTSVGFRNKGVKLDTEGHFSLTPEEIAMQLGRPVAKKTVVDACCGSGGNAIGFARNMCQVTAIELEQSRINQAKHNAKVYQCDSQIKFICGDSAKIIQELRSEILWIDPPWGEYEKSDCKLNDFPFLSQVLGVIKPEQFKEIWIKMPQAFDTSSMPEYKAEAVFGVADGDKHRIKFVLLKKV